MVVQSGTVTLGLTRPGLAAAGKPALVIVTQYLLKSTAVFRPGACHSFVHCPLINSPVQSDKARYFL